jgi:hypothetical protein
MKTRKPKTVSARMRCLLRLQVQEYIAHNRQDPKGCVVKISPTGRMAAVRRPPKTDRK